LSNYDVAKVRQCETTKEIMDKLHSLYGKERIKDFEIIEKSHYILEEEKNDENGSMFIEVVDPI